MNAHTPGPWYHDDVMVIRGKDFVRVGELDRKEKVTPERYNQIMGDRAIMLNGLALLEALELAETYIPAGDRYADDRATVRSAIAKAKGE